MVLFEREQEMEEIAPVFNSSQSVQGRTQPVRHKKIESWLIALVVLVAIAILVTIAVMISKSRKPNRV